ncbi:MAG: response regulator transcription factor [Chitinophagaceae bacterium]|jgi:DNA-binding NarL/FixJ family response regulator|nr:response regulator transcription factor [Chitinophagaceae bacterium]
MIKLIIIDDHPLVADGIATMLKEESYLQIVASAKTGRQGLAILSEYPDCEVILLDINLPDTDGLQLCEQIRQLYPNLKIIGLTSVNEAGIISQMIRRGANGYLLKDMEKEELLHAINRVLDGHVYLSKGANDKILQQLRELDINPHQIPMLTRREKEILSLLDQGLSSQEIASRLSLSIHTIDTHRKNMLQKLNVHNTPALLKAAGKLGLLG